MVCNDCNQCFWDNLEIALARDTFEGMSRFEFSVKKPEEFKSLGIRSRMVITVAVASFVATIILVWLNFKRRFQINLKRQVKYECASA